MIKLLAILNAGNQYTQRIKLSSPISGNYCKFLSNRNALISASFLNASYYIDTNQIDTGFSKNLAVAGSGLSFAIKDQELNDIEIKLEETVDENTLEVQIVLVIY